MVSEKLTFEHLPPEIRDNVLRFLDYRSLLSACSVSRTWYRLISPISAVWYGACQSLGIRIRDGIHRKMCRALFVRLALRWYSIIDSRCFSTRAFVASDAKEITAIYYYAGKLATSSRHGIIKLWECATFFCLWTSKRHSSWVTSIKFDDDIVMASYCDGSIASWSSLTGELSRIYRNPCPYAGSVDFMTDANLVVSAYTAVIGWNMSTGKLLLMENLKDGKCKSIAKVKIESYPNGEIGGCPTVRKILVVCRTEKHVVVWLATSTLKNRWDMNVTMKILNTIWIGLSSICSLITDVHLSAETHFDGEFLYFTRYSSKGYTQTVCQWDVVNKRMVAEFDFMNEIRSLIGVGRKYIIVLTGKDRDQLEIMERQNCNIILRIKIPRYSKSYMYPDEDLCCLGGKSWLDGFDGDNDRGAVYIFALFPNFLNVLEWSERSDQRYLRRWFRKTAVNFP